MPREAAGKICNLQGPLALTILYHPPPNTPGHFVEVPYDAKRCFSTTERCWLSWNKVQMT